MKRKHRVAGAVIIGVLVGGVLGLMIGVYANYGIAQLFAEGREAQAYMTLLVIPSVAILGSSTGLFAGLFLWKRWFALPALLGMVALLVCIGLGISFSWNHRPADFVIENRTSVTFEKVFLGGDFRRSTRVGQINPGATSRIIRVDLDTPGTFVSIDGRAGDGYVRHTFDDARNLPDGDYTIVVSGEPPKFRYVLKRNETSR